MAHVPILPAANRPLQPLSGAPPGGTDPVVAPAAQWDEAVARQADNDLLAGWNRLSDPFFGASGADALAAWPGVEQALADHLTDVRAGFDNDRQRGLFDPVAALRQEAWSARMLAHAGRAASDHNEAQSACRQALAVQGMANAAVRDDADGLAAGLAVLRGEVRGRSARGGLSEAEAAQAEAASLAGAHAQVVERLAADDPQRGQDWLDAHRATIGDPATLGRLDRLLAPFVAAQCAERIADEIRAGRAIRSAASSPASMHSPCRPTSPARQESGCATSLWPMRRRRARARIARRTRPG